MMMKAQMTPTWNDLDNRRSRWLTVVGRLKPGMTAEQAESQINVIYRRINEQEVKEIKNASETFRQRFVGQASRRAARRARPLRLAAAILDAAVVLMSMVGVVLLIACANVANLMLARSTARQKEIAVGWRLAPGAARIVRQHCESLLLAGAGAVVGVLLAVVDRPLLLAALPGDPAAQTLSANPDLRVVGFTLGLALVTALVFGIAPALSATRPAVVTALKEEAGSVVGGGRQARVRRALVVGQVALSMLLLAGAGLFARSLHNLPLSIRASGRQPADVLARSDAQRLRCGADARSSRRRRTRWAPCPASAPCRWPRLAPSPATTGAMTVKVDGYQPKEDEDMNPERRRHRSAVLRDHRRAARQRAASSQPGDALGAPKVAILNETMAKYFFGNTNPDRPPPRIRPRQCHRHRDRRRRPRPPQRAADREASFASSTSRIVRMTALRS